MSGEAGRVDAETLTELALQGVDDRARELCGPESLAEYEALTAFVAACREASVVESKTDGLSDRALLAARSEDLSWRGDLRLVDRFVRDGLRSSLALRLAAASVLVYMASLPVVALFVLTDAPPLPEFRVEVGKRELPYAVNENDGQQDLPVVELDSSVGLNVLLVENTLSWSRWHLSKMEDPRLGLKSEVPSWLERRAEALWGTPLGASTASLGSVFVTAEVELDRVLVVGDLAVGGEAMSGLFVALSEQVGAPSDPATWLALSSLARAESYGVLEQVGAESLRIARSTMPVDHRFRALIEVDGDLRRRLPLDPLWVEAFIQLEPVDESSVWLQRLRKISLPGDR